MVIGLGAFFTGRAVGGELVARHGRVGRGREHVLSGERPASERGGLMRGAGREFASDVRRRLRPTTLCPVNNKRHK